jgi:hypothetical protein
MNGEGSYERHAARDRRDAYHGRGSSDRSVFEIWESHSGNLAGSFETQDEALTVVRDTVEEHGRGAVGSFALLAYENGQYRTIAEGEDLAALASQFSAGLTRWSRKARPASGDSPGGGSRFVRRDDRGQFTTDQVSAGRSLAQDRRIDANSRAPKGEKPLGEVNGKPSRPSSSAPKGKPTK